MNKKTADILSSEDPQKNKTHSTKKITLKSIKEENDNTFDNYGFEDDPLDDKMWE